MKFLKRTLLGVFIYAAIVLLLFALDVLWKSPPHFTVSNYKTLETPIMDMTAYEAIISTHARPYVYSIRSESGGVVHVLGVEHVGDLNHPDLVVIRKAWAENSPSVALIEGRLGFLFTWLQDPIETYGEGGLVAALAKKDGARLFTWEPTREAEIELLLQQFSAEQLALFFSFRPYFSNMRHGKPTNPEEQLQSYLDSRTDYDHLRGIYESWESLDAQWKKDNPNIDWRTYSDEFGWPKGYLFEIANQSNLARDNHLIHVIVELVSEGENVFVTMGASHAPRIEASLRAELQGAYTKNP